MENDLTIDSASVSDRGLSEKRPQNEDSFLDLRLCGIFAVADGVGGAQGGEVASQMAIEILSEAFTHKPEGKDAEEIVRAAIERANAAIYQTSHELPALESMATTIVALHLAADVATIGHVGDSRLYRVDPLGDLHRETDDHSVVADEVRAGRMTAEQAENHPSRNIINRALGAEPTVAIDLKTIIVEPHTTFLICSDGITRHISDEEIRKTLAADANPDSICSYLKTLCYERGAEDNLTAVVVKVGQRVALSSSNLQPPVDEEDTVATVRSNFEASDVANTVIGPAGQDAIPSDSSVFSTTGTFLSLTEDKNDRSGSRWFAEMATYAGILLLGSAIGAAVYHFMLVPSQQAQLPAISEMKSDNIEITSYEKLRRTVDTDPAAYLREVPPPRDAEDFYLAGRAQMLTDDFAQARVSLLEAQKQVPNADISNAKVLMTDIASALAIANDAETQRRFRAEIDGASKFRITQGSNANITR